jgi:hypothetical protein
MRIGKGVVDESVVDAVDDGCNVGKDVSEDVVEVMTASGVATELDDSDGPRQGQVVLVIETTEVTVET